MREDGLGSLHRDGGTGLGLSMNIDLLPERSSGPYRRLEAVPEPGAEDILREGVDLPLQCVGAGDKSRNVTGSILCFQNSVKMD